MRPSFIVSGLICCIIPLQFITAFSTGKHTWLQHHEFLAPKCTISRLPLDSISKADFDQYFLEQSPVILEGTKQKELASKTEKATLIKHYGDVRVSLSSANTFSHEKSSQKLQDYISTFGESPDHKNKANESFYLFGPHAELSPHFMNLISTYKPPPFSGDDLAFSFGIGGHASGIPFHVHGHGFSEVIHGSKRWLLYPPDRRPMFNPDVSPVQWLQEVYPRLVGRDKDLLEECNIYPGDVLYFPSGWWHAVVNVGETVFVSSFEKSTLRKSMNFK